MRDRTPIPPSPSLSAASYTLRVRGSSVSSLTRRRQGSTLTKKLPPTPKRSLYPEVNKQKKPALNRGYQQVVHFLRTLENPPPYVEYVKEYLDRMVMQYNCDDDGLKKKFARFYNELTKRDRISHRDYEGSVNEIFGLAVANKTCPDEFRKIEMLSWFRERFKETGKHSGRWTGDNAFFESGSYWYDESPLHKDMASFFTSSTFQQYLRDSSQLLYNYQVTLSKLWQQVGLEFALEWHDIGKLGREALIIRALRDMDIDQPPMINQHGMERFAGWREGRKPRRFSELGQWSVEFSVPFHSNDPALLPFLVSRYLHLPTIKSPAIVERPFFPQPPEFLKKYLPPYTKKVLERKMSNPALQNINRQLENNTKSAAMNYTHSDMTDIKPGM